MLFFIGIGNAASRDGSEMVVISTFTLEGLPVTNSCHKKLTVTNKHKQKLHTNIPSLVLSEQPHEVFRNFHTVGFLTTWQFEENLKFYQ